MAIKYLIISFFLFLNCSSKQQTDTKELKKALVAFLKSEKEIVNDKTDVFIINILNYEPYSGQKGIYKFGVLGSHHLEYLVFIDNTSFEIYKRYKIDIIMPKILSHFQDLDLEESEKLTSVKNITKVLKDRLDISESITIPEEIDY